VDYIAPSEHGVVVARFIRHDLEDVPVFDDFAVFIHAENIDTRSILTRPFLVTVQHDKVALSDGALKVHAPARVFLRHPLKV
jgi:hypothetical protein